MKKVNILGTEYEIRELTEKEFPALESNNAVGLCERFSKEIILDIEHFGIPKPTNSEDFHLFKKQVLRHEIIHAFFHESGQTDYCEDEKLVEFLAIQIPKMFKVFEKLEILE